jgi:glycosyltransferase involved in cell wall biosynthesis
VGGDAFGQSPRQTLADRLAEADTSFAAGDATAAAHRFAKGVRAAFQRDLHFDSLMSPLASDPEGFTAPLRDSTTARALRSPRGRDRTSTRPARRRGLLRRKPPTKVLVLTRTNRNFLGRLLDHLETHPGFEVRFFDLAEAKALVKGINDPAVLATEILTGDRTRIQRAERRLRPLLDWADTVFLEWCTAHAALFTMLDPRDTRVVVRLHSYEAFTPWPHLVDFGRVDDLVFVSDHVRDLAVAAIPGLREPNAPRLHSIPLGMTLGRYVRPKQDAARFHLGMVGWASVAKDPLWALEVLRQVRRHDERYRLLLVGDDFKETVSPTAEEYAARLHDELTDLEQQGAVRRTGRTEDVPGALTDLGVILSSSVRESFHAGLVEGAASGAVPVVRDWPFFAGRSTGASTLFPADWVVGSPEEAAERVLRATATEDRWRETGAAASKHALSSWDWDAVKGRYDDLLRS